MANPDKGDFAVAGEAELFADGLKRTFFDAGEQNAHLLKSWAQLLLTVL